MSMQESSRGLRATGDPRDVSYADIIDRIFQVRGDDVPLPNSESSQTVETVMPEEASRKIEKFSDEAREALEARGFTIVELTGQSIKTIKTLPSMGHKFSSTWHEAYPDFEARTSRRSEVAIIPDELFLPDSDGKNLSEQEAMVAAFSKGLKIKGVKAIIGEVADYAELTFNHLAATTAQGKPEYLFEDVPGYGRYTRTKTPTLSGGVANIGSFLPPGVLDYYINGMVIWGADSSLGFGRVSIAPLVVPDRK